MSRAYAPFSVTDPPVCVFPTTSVRVFSITALWAPEESLRDSLPAQEVTRSTIGMGTRAASQHGLTSNQSQKSATSGSITESAEMSERLLKASVHWAPGVVEAALPAAELYLQALQGAYKSGT